MKGCQWHFKSDVKNHINKVGPSHREMFSEICNEMCRVTTVSAFNDLMTELKLISDIYPELQGFVKYWGTQENPCLFSVQGRWFARHEHV